MGVPSNGADSPSVLPVARDLQAAVSKGMNLVCFIYLLLKIKIIYITGVFIVRGLLRSDARFCCISRSILDLALSCFFSIAFVFGCFTCSCLALMMSQPRSLARVLSASAGWQMPWLVAILHGWHVVLCDFVDGLCTCLEVELVHLCLTLQSP